MNTRAPSKVGTSLYHAMTQPATMSLQPPLPSPLVGPRMWVHVEPRNPTTTTSLAMFIPLGRANPWHKTLVGCLTPTAEQCRRH